MLYDLFRVKEKIVPEQSEIPNDAYQKTVWSLEVVARNATRRRL